MSARAQLANLRKILIAEDYRKFALLIVAMFIAALLQVVGVASILPFMELVARPDAIDQVPLLRWAYDTFGFDSERQMLIWAGAGVFTLFTLSILVTLYVGWFIDRTSWATVHRLCVSQLSVYLQLPYEFFLRTNTANLLQRVVAEINLLLSDVLLAGCQLFAQSVLAIGMLVVMSTVNATLTAISLFVFGGLYLCIHLLRHTFIVRLSAERIEKDNQRYTAFIETITGLKAIRSSNASSFFLERFSAASGTYARIHPFFNLAISVPRYLMEIIAFGGILIAVLYMVSAGGDFAAALPEIALFAVAFYRLTPALHGVFESAARLSKGLPTVEAVTRDLHPEEDLEPLLDRMPPSELGFAQQVALVGVTHQYQGTSTPVLTQIDAAIAKGECVAFVGQTGSGKTTLIDLIVGLLRPSAGHIAVDGVPLISNAIAQWRRNVAYVPQDVFLYDSTIADNIVFGPGQPDQSRMRWAARVAGLETFIEKELEKGYDTEVGERGTRLSGGQRQRVGIARAIYRMPQLLVLDEATSALDGVTEQAVLTEIRRELPDVTIVMVTHRLSTTRACDRIFLLNQGRLNRVGTFDELHRESALFRAIATTGAEGDGSTVQDQPEAVR